MDPTEFLQQLDGQTAFDLGRLLTLLIGGFAVWVAMDARDRGWTRVVALYWGLGVLVFALPMVLVYLVARVRFKPQAQTLPEIKACKYCEKPFAGDPAYCPHCSKQLKGAEEIHRRK